VFVGTVKRYSKPRKTAGTGGRAFLGQEIFEAVDSGLTRGLAWLESAVFAKLGILFSFLASSLSEAIPKGIRIRLFSMGLKG